MSTAADLLDLVLPRRCIGCAAAGSLLCPRCLPAGELVAAWAGGQEILAAARYEGAVRAALLRYKERGRRDLASPLGDLLARAVCGVLDSAGHQPALPTAHGGGGPSPLRPTLVPVPSARSAVAARGGDHVARLARRVAGRTGTPIADALVLTRAVRDSAGLGIAERAANLDTAMAARQAPPGRAAILVDDIVTTGATLREARRALVAARWPVLGAAAVAATPRRATPIERDCQPIGRPR